MILSNIFQTMGNKEWIAFANEKNKSYFMCIHTGVADDIQHKDNQNPCDRHIFITVFYSIAISRQEVKIIYKSVKILKAFSSKSIYNVGRICCGAISAPQQSIKLKHKNL